MKQPITRMSTSSPMRLLVNVCLAVMITTLSALPSVYASPFREPSAVRSYGPSPNTAQSSPPPTEPDAWPMVGANPERTSWTPEEVRGQLKPVWYKPFESYISQKVQIIAAYNTLYISTAHGLYAIDAETGTERWVYPTELPLGHSPTIANGVAYVGGFDRRIHAIDAFTGKGLWTYTAGAGFHTNPLVVDGIVYAGNRDGIEYAIHAEGTKAGQLAWQYQTGGPVLYSAAFKDDAVFFASQDSHAYALNAQTGALLWKSAKLPGAGFRSWWPVVYRNRVIFSGSNNYRFYGHGLPQILDLDLADVYPNHETDPRGTLIGAQGTEPGDWVEGTITIDASRALNHLLAKPWRRPFFILDRFTGENQETAPVLWAGNDGVGNHYPPVVAADDVLYQQNNYMSDKYIAGGHISGWKFGTPFISRIAMGWNAVDEPIAASAGGNLVYWSNCCDRVGGAIDISLPAVGYSNRSWNYYGYNTGNGSSLTEKLPGYSQYYTPDSGIDVTMPYASFGQNGAYGWHGDSNPPIPYRGKVYMIRSNSIIALGDSDAAPVSLPAATITSAPPTNTPPQDVAVLKSQLNQEIANIVAAGHLRPGYHSHGVIDLRGNHECADGLVDYWHQPAETLYALLQALPHLPAEMQGSVRSYLQAEFAQYPPYRYNHTGWRDGAPREIFDLPPEVEAAMATSSPGEANYNFIWRRNPFLFYALWKYAYEFGDAPGILNASEQAFWSEFDRQPADDVLLKMPHVHNAYISGYLGFLELETLAGRSQTSSVQQELNRLMQLRANNFTKDSAYAAYGTNNSRQAYCRTLNISNNFMYLVPELADYLREHAQEKVRSALAEYYQLAPYWFVSFAEEGFAENYTALLYDGYSLFMAKALILQEPGEELEKYLDVPGFARGDLFYIQKLVAAIENYGSTPPPTPAPTNTPAPTPTPTSTPAPTATPPTPGSLRINIPHLAENAGAEQAAVAWFGQVNSTGNYADVRVSYTDSALRVILHIFDRLLWYDESPEAADLENWDAVSLYLDSGGNTGNTPAQTSHRFVIQANHWQNDQLYQAAYKGNGGDWAAATTGFTGSSGWRGSGLNNDSEARGWVATFEIPFSSLGVSVPPSGHDVWGMALVLHDRDDSAGTSIPVQTWPGNVHSQKPVTWGELAFSIPGYKAPAASPGGTSTVRQGLDGATVVDAHVGGHTICGQDYWPDFFNGWGDANFAGYDQINIQNQWDVADWPCFSKYYVTFPLDNVPAGKTIISATLTMHQFGNAGGPNWDPPVEPSFIQVMNIDKAWNEASLTWNNAPLPVENLGGAWSYPQDNTQAYDAPVSWDVGRAAAQAYGKGQPLRLALYSADSAYHSGKYFWSSDAAEWNAQSRPTLTVTWGDPVDGGASGDVSCDNQSDSVDALFILQSDVGLRQQGNQCPLPPDTLYTPGCDVNTDSNCNVVDSLFILQCTIGISNAWCAAAASDSEPADPAAAEDGSASITGASILAEEGDKISMPIYAKIPSGRIGAATLEIHYNPTKLKPLGCKADPNNSFDSALCNIAYSGNDPKSGALRLGLISTSGVAGDQLLVRLRFQIIGQAGDKTKVSTNPLVWASPKGINQTVQSQDAVITITGSGTLETVYLPAVQR